MTTADDLRERVKGLSGRSRAVDYDLYLLAGNKITNERALTPAQRLGHLEAFAPRYTDSIDAALALVERMLPKGDWAYSLVNDYGGLNRVHLNIAPGCEGWPNGGFNSNADGDTMPLAIILALLNAISASEATNAR